jgi:hypothetical protein
MSSVARPVPIVTCVIPDNVEPAVEEIPVEAPAPAGAPPKPIPPPGIPPHEAYTVVSMWILCPTAVIIVVILPVFIIPVFASIGTVIIINEICVVCKKWCDSYYQK